MSVKPLVPGHCTVPTTWARTDDRYLARGEGTVSLNKTDIIGLGVTPHDNEANTGTIEDAIQKIFSLDN